MFLLLSFNTPHLSHMFVLLSLSTLPNFFIQHADCISFFFRLDSGQRLVHRMPVNPRKMVFVSTQEMSVLASSFNWPNFISSMIFILTNCFFFHLDSRYLSVLKKGSIIPLTVNWMSPTKALVISWMIQLTMVLVSQKITSFFFHVYLICLISESTPSIWS